MISVLVFSDYRKCDDESKYTLLLFPLSRLLSVVYIFLSAAALCAISIKRMNPRVPLVVQMTENTFTTVWDGILFFLLTFVENLISYYPDTRVLQGQALNVALVGRSVACPGYKNRSLLLYD